VILPVHSIAWLSCGKIYWLAIEDRSAKKGKIQDGQRFDRHRIE
jgi:hypothetical protein